MDERIANASRTYGTYLGKMLWPEKLTMFYPHLRVGLGEASVWLSFLLIAGAALLAVPIARRAPYFPVGWFWRLGALVPVNGLVQAGEQGAADRYAYVSLIGIFVLAAWGLAGPCGRSAAARWTAATALSASMVALLLATRAQTRSWVSDRAMWEHAEAVTGHNHMAENALGCYLMT